MKVDIFNTDKKYNIIYADPPWVYKAWSKKGNNRSAENHYNTMQIQDICELPISNISDKDCVLLMWATYPTLQEAFKVIEAWGFTYKTVAFAWVKRNKKSPTWFWGMGYWTRSNSEICLIATKGKPKRISAGVHQVIDAPIEQHSKKPDITRDKIIQLLGDIPKIELFARQTMKGWDCWGNEV